MDYKLMYLGKTEDYDAFVYDIDGFYVYVVVDYNNNVEGPNGPYKDLEPISSRMKLENPSNVDETKQDLAERRLQQRFSFLQEEINSRRKRIMSNFNI